MKNFLIIFFVSTLLIQCKPKEKETSKIQFYINNFDFNYDQMEVTFELINNSNEICWSLFGEVYLKVNKTINASNIMHI